MNISRRDFMKMVGVSIASLTLTNCRVLPVTCYAPLPPSPTPTEPITERDQLRSCWMRFGELAQATLEEADEGSTDNTLGQYLSAEHRQALDALVTTGELTPVVAELIQEAYDAALYHVWRSNAPMTCYEPMMVDYAPTSAGILVHQSEVLASIAEEGSVDPEAMAIAQSALEHDLAYYALSEEEISMLYDRLVAEWQGQQGSIPSFEELELEITPEVETAARFIIDLLVEK